MVGPHLQLEDTVAQPRHRRTHGRVGVPGTASHVGAWCAILRDAMRYMLTRLGAYATLYAILGWVPVDNSEQLEPVPGKNEARYEGVI